MFTTRVFTAAFARSRRGPNRELKVKMHRKKRLGEVMYTTPLLQLKLLCRHAGDNAQIRDFDSVDNDGSSQHLLH